MLLMLESFEAINGLVAVFRDEVYLVPSTRLAISIDYTVWGSTHILIGLVAVAAGLGIMAAKTWARVIGVVFARVQRPGQPSRASVHIRSGTR